MNGKEIYNKLSQMEYGDLIQGISQKLPDNPETVLVGIFIVLRDMETLLDCEDGDALKVRVLDRAEAWEQYAGLPYDEFEHLDPDDEDFLPADDGLARVEYLDLWQTFEEIAAGK